MTEHRPQDEQDLIDFLLGQSDDAPAIQRRLQDDPTFLRLYNDLKNTFAALDLLEQPPAPADLTARTMDRIRRRQGVNVLLARQEINRRTWFRPTFTMRDMVGAAAAVILLAIVFVPSLWEARRQSRIDQCASQAGQIGAALQAYANDHQGQLPAAVTDQASWLPSPTRRAVSNSASLFQLVPQQYAPAGIFQCPGLGGGPVGLALRAGMTDFPSRKYISYSYQHALGQAGLSRTNPDLAAVASEMAILADNTPLFSDGQFRPERLKRLVSDNHSRTGQNVLYLDMHVAWSKVAEAGVAGDNIYLIKGVYSYRGDEAPHDPTDSFLLPAYTAGR